MGLFYHIVILQFKAEDAGTDSRTQPVSWPKLQDLHQQDHFAPSSLALSCLMQKDLTRPAIPRGVQRKVLLAVSLALGLITASVNQLVPFWDTPILAQVSFLVYLFPIQL